MIYLSCLLCLVWEALGTSANMSLTDEGERNMSQVISEILGMAKSDDRTEYPIEPLHIRWKFHKLPGSLDCYDGYVKSIDALNKSGKVSVEREGSTDLVTIPMSLGTLEYGYRQCRYKLIHLFRWGGTVSVVARNSSLHAQTMISREEDGGCQAFLANVMFQEIREVSVAASGRFGRRLQSSMTPSLTAHMNREAAGRVVQELQRVAAKAITQEYLCNTLPKFLLN